LLTKEEASEKKMSDIIRKEILIRRFDAIQSNYVVRLWERAAKGFNIILNSQHQIFWNCEEVKMPFQNIEDASLLMFLSEGNHPTDGNDYLFLLIYHIINKSNLFSQRLHEFHKVINSDSIMPEVHPKFVIRGNHAATAVSSLNFYSLDDLASLIESVWCVERGLYDLNKISPVIFEEMIGFLIHRPAILDPLSFLRERFQFRDEKMQTNAKVESSQASYRSSIRHYFVRIQDMQLFEDVWHSLMKLKLDKPRSLEGLTRTFSVHFYQADYECLRSILEGLRTSTKLLLPNTSDGHQTLFQAVSLFFQETDKYTNLQSLGFPTMSDMQLQFILSLELEYLPDFVTFLGYQLASEAYSFSNLSLSMTDPLTTNVMEEIVSNCRRMCFSDADEKNSSSALREAMKSLDSFVNDGLKFYEAQICDAASSATNKSLRIFLKNNNFCDDGSFPFFACIPEEVTLHNYVPLRQLLHQTKLQMLWKHENSGILATNPDSVVGTDDPIEMVALSTDLSGSESVRMSFSRPHRGNHWLWAEEVIPDIVMEDCEDDRKMGAEINPEEANYGGLWFQRRSADDEIQRNKVDLPSECMEIDQVNNA
jgi:hypothetical protein